MPGIAKGIVIPWMTDGQLQDNRAASSSAGLTTRKEVTVSSRTTGRNAVARTNTAPGSPNSHVELTSPAATSTHCARRPRRPRISNHPTARVYGEKRRGIENTIKRGVRRGRFVFASRTASVTPAKPVTIVVSVASKTLLRNSVQVRALPRTSK
jgi:hypothetical protein